MSDHRTSRRRLAQAATLFTLVLAGSVGAASPEAGTSTDTAAHYTYKTIDYPGASVTIFWGINDLGEMAGQYTLSGQPAHAMVYSDGRFESPDPEGLFGDNFSAAGGPTNNGTVFGGYADASKQQHGFVIRRGQVETVDFPGRLNSNVDGVNTRGDIAGVYWDADGIYHGVLRHHGHDTPIDVPGARDTYPLGISANGEIVGYWDTKPGETHGFHRSASGQFSSIDVPTAKSGGTVAFGINDVGQVTGYYVDTSGLIHGFIKTRGNFQNLDVPGARATIATAVNNLGEVAGQYFDATGKRHGFVATPR
ncbi:hypothetical protein [Lysobacter tyrosinilyticus]